MAIARMLRLELLAHSSLKSKLISTLQENGIIQITSSLSGKIQPQQEQSEQVNDLKELLAEVNSALDFIDSNNVQKKSFLESMIPSKTNIAKNDFYNIENNIKLKSLLNNISDLEIHLQETITKIEELRNRKKELEQWKDVEQNIIEKFKSVEFSTGQILSSKFTSLDDELKGLPCSEIIKIAEDQGKTYLIILFHKDYSNQIKDRSSKQGFQSLFVESDPSPSESYRQISEELDEKEKFLKELNKTIKSILKEKSNLIIARDFIQNKINKIEIEENFIHSKKAVLIQGWVPEKQKDNLVSIMQPLGKEIEYNFSEPSIEDKPPIILQNPNWLKPLEAVTTLYGYPDYWEKDPTPHLAPFFLLFFAIAIGDVGYGILIAILAWFLYKKMDVSENGKNFIKLFIYGGLASIIPGVLMGSWFAVDIKTLPVFLQKMILIDPLKDPMLFLIVCLILGFIHLYWGVVVEMIDGFKDSKIGSLMDNGPVLLFLPGFALLIVLAFMSSSGQSPTWSPAVKWFSLIGAAAVVLFTNRSGKNIFSKLGGGLYNLYGMSAFIGDTISYARLMALGLATFLIGQAINLMAKLFYSMFGLVLGIIVSILVLVIGHIFNIVINLISAFIHPARLQYVEFFTKFFEGGGQNFKPFKLESKDLNIVSEK